ncbi:MAG: flagellar basal body-associated FliL family protein [Chitinispirillaceae bacterium]|nr:flagellar basal body-associated FliL family protein [Chitinispirillaceae bacterium]
MDEKKPKEAPSKGEREKEEGKKGPAEPKAPKSNKLLLIGIIAGVVVIEIIAGIAVVKMIMPKPVMEMDLDAHEGAAAHNDEKAMTAMGATTSEMPVEVLVNIAGTDGERFLKAAVVLEYVDQGGMEKKKEGGHGHGGGASLSPMAEAIQKRLPKYQSFLIEYLSKMTITEVTAPDAKEKIRKDFMRHVNYTLPPNLGEIKDIYFTQFIIQ